MCGHDWCSVRISREITEFASGKDEAYAWEKPTVSSALTAEQQRILEQRGVLSAEEIHRLATKTKKAMASPGGAKAACHSELVPGAAEAHRAQAEKADEQLVPLNTAPAHNLPSHDPIV